MRRTITAVAAAAILTTGAAIVALVPGASSGANDTGVQVPTMAQYSTLTTQVAALQGDVADLESRVTALENSTDPAPTPPSTDPTPTPTPDPTPSSPSNPTPAAGFPTATTTGLPDGWTPKTTLSSLTITTPGTTITDTRVTGDVLIEAPNVTLNRVEVVNGRINNFYKSTCQSGLTIENSYIHNTTVPTDTGGTPYLQVGGYTAINVKMDKVTEGFRVGGDGNGCGPVSISDSWVHVWPPTGCTGNAWHGDGLQGYDGNKVTIRNTYLQLSNTSDCGGTSSFFYPKNQGNTSLDVDGLIVNGGGYPFRDGMPGTIRHLYVVDGSWSFAPVSVDCSQPSVFQANRVTLDPNGQPVVGAAIPCTGSGT